ncbi:hypothetical protein [Helicobacter sp. UBA3407]|uniref:hypothetical protein n=2 Tax=Helicobacteraceae TaxID=72293 RepID=UPI002630A7B0|nr:hypothetical protein [Helicobacter sp. UBA3407]
MKNENTNSKEDLQALLQKYKSGSSEELEAGLASLNQEEQKEFIKEILEFEKDNYKNGTLKTDEKFNVIFPPNFKVVMAYEKTNFNSAILSKFIKDLEEYLEQEEMELYDDPADFEGGDYWSEDSNCDEDYTIEDWVADKMGYLRDFIDSLKDFK